MRTIGPVVFVVLAGGLMASSLAAQNPLRHFTDAEALRYARSQPILEYTLTIGTTESGQPDTTGFDVTIAVRNAPGTFRLAMAKHPEYDDRFFRYVHDVRVAESGATVTRLDSVLWKVVAPNGRATISYRVQPPPSPTPRAAWRPFMSTTGALTGGPHAFMYVVGAELAPAQVRVALPAGWSIATGMTRTADPRVFAPASAYELLESPLLVGALHDWRFFVDGVPHTVAYWSLPTGARFDSVAFTRNVERFALEVAKLFGRPAYREYVFQFQDAAYGALEHPNSVSLGLPSEDLARDPAYGLEEVAHEFFHTWNLMRIRPAEYTGVDYRAIQPVPSLWFSEGLTMFYADALLRRAGLPTDDSTRIAHLEYLLRRYYGQPGNTRFSAERVSRAEYGTRPDVFGDYDASTHLQGELFGTVLDLRIRDVTQGTRSMDDVMRLMLERYSGTRGFTNADLARTLAEVCGCDMKAFFDAHIRGAEPIPFERYLRLAGLGITVGRDTVRRDGRAISDYRIRAWNPPGSDSTLSLLLNDPTSVWGRAGLHTGYRVVSVNSATPRTFMEFRRIIGDAQIGDTLRFVVRPTPAAAPRAVNVVVTGWVQPRVRITPLAGATQRQLRLREAWLSARAAGSISDAQIHPR
jgi:predicted metalloprotease with PDZ domain